MVTARTVPRGLSTSELEKIGGSLAGGRRPRVMFTPSAGQIAGQFGQVVRLGDPATADEWVFVRFGRDELPFSPGDLTLPPKTPRARRGAPTGEAAGAMSSRQGSADPPGPPLLPAAPPAPPRARGRTAVAAATGPQPARPVRPAASRTVPTNTVPTRAGAAPADGGTVSAGAPPAASDPAGARPAAGRAAARARPKPTAELTVTIAYAGGNWSVAAIQGTKVLVKPHHVRSGDAVAMVAALGVPAVRQAVEEIVAAVRAETEREADRLRAELAAVESRLAELGS